MLFVLRGLTVNCLVTPAHRDDSNSVDFRRVLTILPRYVRLVLCLFWFILYYEYTITTFNALMLLFGQGMRPLKN